MSEKPNKQNKIWHHYLVRNSFILTISVRQSKSSRLRHLQQFKTSPSNNYQRISNLLHKRDKWSNQYSTCQHGSAACNKDHLFLSIYLSRAETTAPTKTKLEVNAIVNMIYDDLLHLTEIDTKRSRVPIRIVSSLFLA